MNKPIFFRFLVLSLMAFGSVPACAGTDAAVRSPVQGVLCDKSMCANENGVSRPLTEKYLGKKAMTKLFSQGGFDITQFTFSNGIFCDVKERLCRKNRYFGIDGKRSGAVSSKFTALLFGKGEGVS